LGGVIINVSGWKDEDKAGGVYRDYYKEIEQYTISNIGGLHGMPEYKDPKNHWLELDLCKPVSKDLVNRFDVVFNHTVLEHVAEIEIALDNLARMSKDMLVIVVPFSQSMHYTGSYSDYLRFTPFYFTESLKKYGYTLLVFDKNQQPFEHIYITMIFSRYPEKHSFIDEKPENLDVLIQPGRFGRYKKTAKVEH
jgi:hypothetical protein